jgi:hypothetical protein
MMLGTTSGAVYRSLWSGYDDMTKKKMPVFGQLTLTGEMALDWMKNGTEAEVARIEIGPIGAFQNYNVPDWAAEKTGDIALLHNPNQFANPILVTQRSILRLLEIWCVEKESQGGKTSVQTAHGVQFGVLELEEDSAQLKFWRDEKKGQFAPYQMEEI